MNRRHPPGRVKIRPDREPCKGASLPKARTERKKDKGKKKRKTFMATVGYAALPFLVFAACMALFLRMMHDIGARGLSMRRGVVRRRSGQTPPRFKA
jgi:hypothetical protein